MAVGLTVPDGIPVELPGSQPLESLTGGSSATGPILAEVVQALFIAQAATIAALTDRVAALETIAEATRWRHIDEGTQSGGTSFSITVPSGFSRLRLSLVGDLAALGPVNVRLNGDTDTDYQRGFLFWNASGAQETPEYNGATTSVKVAEWSTTESNKADVEIAVADGTQGVSIKAYSMRTSAAGDTGHEIQFGWGKYVTAAVVTSVDVFTTGTTFAACRWYLEGYLAP